MSITFTDTTGSAENFTDVSQGYFLLLENGDKMLLESGNGAILLEQDKIKSFTDTDTGGSVINFTD